VSLQQTGPADLVTASGKVMPSLAGLLPGIEDHLPPDGTYNLGLRRDTPMEIIQQIQDAFVAAAASAAFKEMVAVRNFAIAIVTGERADRRAAEFETVSAAVFSRLDIPGSRTAAELGLPAPEQFDSWWPPAGYAPLPLTGP
jgi:putative tricarboxylic transport membrane protein